MKRNKSKLSIFLYVLWIIAAVIIVVYIFRDLNPKIVYRTVKSLTKLIFLVMVACFLGSIFEYKAWYRFASFLASPLVRFGRLPKVSGTAFLVALFSNPAANTIITGSYEEGKITRKEMFISGLCNSYPAMVSHSLRILFPLVGAIGLAAVYYYSITFGVGLLMTFMFLTYSRIKSSNIYNGPIDIKSLNKTQLSWNEIFRKSAKRTLKVLIRMLVMTVPLYIIFLYASKKGIFTAWNNFIPSGLENFISPQIMSVLIARFGGLVNAAGVASEFLPSHEITSLQIVFAFLLGNIITNPIRSIRRNLPVALGIFPNKDGLWIVLILQIMRFIFILASVIIIMVYISS
ncbi:MAG TPA: hypothetical protein QF753_19595 [Victivallales bacterium]|nr:hypothetical protein [Victivallales bacterium]